MPTYLVTVTGRTYEVSQAEYDRLQAAGMLDESGQRLDPVLLDETFAEFVGDPQSLTRAAVSEAAGTAVPASTTVAGVVELATTAEATTGTDTARAVTPAGLKASVDAASTADRARANHTGTQAASSISDLTETVQDIVGALIVAGTGTVVSYDDTAGTFTITATGGTGGTTDPEIVRDVIGTALVAGAGVQITLNDAGDTITIASTAVLPTRTITTTAPLSGGGDLSADRTLTVATATTTATGVVELATTTETTTGTDTVRAVTPAGVKAVADTKAGAASTGAKLWIGTQAAYDAIATKDATTLYAITG